jgi:CHRD domain
MLDVAVPAASVPRDGESAARSEVTATGARSVPPSKVAFQAAARFSFNDQTRELAYDIRVSGTVADVGGVYLHRRANRQNGGVAYVLAKSASPRITGVVTLTTAEAADLKAGKCYVAVISAKSPRMSARGDLVFS